MTVFEHDHIALDNANAKRHFVNLTPDFSANGFAGKYRR